MTFAARSERLSAALGTCRTLQLIGPRRSVTKVSPPNWTTTGTSSLFTCTRLTRRGLQERVGSPKTNMSPGSLRHCRDHVPA